MVLARVMMLAHVMVLACDGWGRESRSLSSDHPKGPRLLVANIGILLTQDLDLISRV